MSAWTTRAEAWRRILAAFEAQLDRVIPLEETVPPKGVTFADFEDQVETLAQAASALNEDRGTHLDGKQVHRWAETLGAARTAEVRAFERGQRPAEPADAPRLLVVGMDGGRLQTLEKQGENGSRWREDKVGTLTSYQPGDGTREHPPQPLVTTYVATMGATEAFGKLLRVEAERRGLRRMCGDSVADLAVLDDVDRESVGSQNIKVA